MDVKSGRPPTVNELVEFDSVFSSHSGGDLAETTDEEGFEIGQSNDPSITDLDGAEMPASDGFTYGAKPKSRDHRGLNSGHERGGITAIDLRFD